MCLYGSETTSLKRQCHCCPGSLSLSHHHSFSSGPGTEVTSWEKLGILGDSLWSSHLSMEKHRGLSNKVPYWCAIIIHVWKWISQPHLGDNLFCICFSCRKHAYPPALPSLSRERRCSFSGYAIWVRGSHLLWLVRMWFKVCLGLVWAWELMWWKFWELRGQLACLAAMIKVLWSIVPSVVIQP